MTENNHKPDEQEIERLLARFRPRPSARFYRQMRSAPWKKSNPIKGAMPGNRQLAFAVLAVLVLVVAGLASPAVRTMAGQIMHFFLPAAGDQMAIQVTIQPEEPALMSTAASFPLSLEEARSRVNYPLKEIPVPPDGMVLNGARYNPELDSIALRYQGEGKILVLTQRPLGAVEEYSSIGASAPVETLQVRGEKAEYVTGGWQVKPGEGERLMTAVPGTEVSLGVYWNPDLPQKMLRWEEGGMMYELLSSGPSIGKDKLLSIAETIR